jgi:predicted transcriptional regulator YdeE
MIKSDSFKLIGLKLKDKTTNANGQSNIDCGNLWKKFLTEGILDKIHDKVSNETFAVYFDYDGDKTMPFSYFIGCKVKNEAIIPQGLDSLIIPQANYKVVTAKGKMPECIAVAWKEIWEKDIPRAYQFDFEVYGEKSADWSNAEVPIFLSVKHI